MPPSRSLGRCLLLAVVAIGVLAPSDFASAQTLPKNIKIVVPFSPGASNDLFARALGQRLAQKYGVTVVVDNRPGAGGSIGSALVARAEPDGSTLMLTSASFATNGATQKNLPFDPVKSFEPVAMLAHGPMLLVVSNSTPFKSVPDYLDAARAPSGGVNYGTPGVGSIAHLGSELLNVMARTTTTHVPYKGVSNVVSDMMGGNLQMTISTPASVNGPLKAGSIRPLAVTSLQRSKFAPELPSLSEFVPGFDLEVWWGVFAPAKTPKPIVDLLNAEIRAWGQTPEMREMYARESTEPASLSPAEFKTVVSEDLAKWRRVVKDRNITIE